MQSTVFISHAKEDKERFVNGFAKKLQQNEIPVWVDDREILLGDNLIEKIFNDGINNSKFIIIIISDISNKKAWVREEIHYSFNKKINSGATIIPVIIDDCQVPPPLDTLRWIKINNLENYDEDLKLIINSIRIKAEKSPLGEIPRSTTHNRSNHANDKILKPQSLIKQIPKNSLEHWYISLDHSIPYYNDHAITLKKTSTPLIVNVPEKHTSILNQDRNVFEIRKSTIHLWDNELLKISEYFGIPDIHALIEETSDSIAHHFIAEINEGKHRFNSSIWGIKKIKPNREGPSETPSLILELYETDYFTHRVFGDIYNRLLKSNKMAFSEINIPTLNKYYTPFMGSFGIGAFLIIEHNGEDAVIIANRSDLVLVDRNKLHYSVNEAFSINDVESIDSMPSLKACLFRGIREELGIGYAYRENIVQYGFMDLGVITNRCELGISAFVRLQWNEKFTLEDLINCYKTAQDSDLETVKLNIIPLNELQKYLEKYHNDFSLGCRERLNMLLTRWLAYHI